jgi:hypothetical protein
MHWKDWKQPGSIGLVWYQEQCYCNVYQSWKRAIQIENLRKERN